MFSQLAAALLLLAPVNAFWILTHPALTYERLDPIVNPGQVSGHVHSVVGGNAFAPTMDFAKTQTSTCTTSPVEDDKSSYWSPTLFHRSQAGDFQAIPISFVQTYYLQRPGKDGKVVAFPPGLRMVAGNPYRTKYDPTNMEDKAINFVCLNYKGGSVGPIPQFPQQNCPDGLRLQVNFPSCWNGKDLDSADHKSHMAYPIGNPDAGECPTTHPVKTVLLFNEYVYDTGKFDFQAGKDNWVLSMGDTTGLGFHADFLNGWKQSTLEAAVAQCTGELFGELEKCAPFAASLNRDKASKCKLAPVVDEDVLSKRKALPGCNQYNPGQTARVSQCPGMAIPAIIGGPGATVIPGSPASSTSVVSSPAASTKAETSSAAASSVAATASPVSSAVTSAVTSKATATSAVTSKSAVTSVVTSAVTSQSAQATSTSPNPGHGHHGHGHFTKTLLNPSGPIRTVSVPNATATAIGGHGPKNCKRNVARDARRAVAEAKYKRAVSAHHAGVKARLATHH